MLNPVSPRKVPAHVSDRCVFNVTISNALGLHARPAMAFAQTAAEHACDVRVRKEGQEPVDGKSVMHIMLLAATKGTELEIVAEGHDAADCCERLRALVERGFDEE